MKFNPDQVKQDTALEGFWKGGLTSQASQEFSEKQLPMDAKKEAFLEAVRNQSSTILIGETGSGKTTCTPGYLLDAFPDAKIAFTSPRVLPALSVSEYVAEKRGGRVGGEIGVITRQERSVSDETRLSFMTDGILLSMFKKDPLLMEFDIVTVDEAHERSLNIDICLGLLKQAQEKRKAHGEKELKIIVASATIEEEKFVIYFDDQSALKVPGRMYPVGVVYVPPSLDQSGKQEPESTAAARLTKKIIDSSEGGDILIFMPGEQEIYSTIEEIELLVGSDNSLEILPLYGSMQKNEQKKVFTNNGKQKIIVSTNVAETSLTIPGVRHVIDTGTVKQKQYNPVTGIDELKLIKTSQANMNQRKGRAGRVAPGTCYRLMSEEDFNLRDEFLQPEIRRANLGETVLRMKDMGINDVENFPFIDSPSRTRINDAVKQLRSLGALDEKGYITEVGKEMAHLQMRPDISRMLLEAKHEGVLETMVTLCSILSAEKPVMIQGKPEKAKSLEEENKTREQMANQDKLKIQGSDFLTLLNVWNEWILSGYSGPFAYNHLLNARVLKDIGLARTQLLKNLAESGVQVDTISKPIDAHKMLLCLYKGSPGGLFYNNGSGKFSFKKAEEFFPFNEDPALYEAKIFPGSTVFKNGGNLLFALNVARTEKKITDRYGEERIVSNLWAKICHKLTYETFEALVPGSVTEKEEGEPYVNYSGSGYKQAVGVYVLGKKLETKEKFLPEYVPPAHSRSNWRDAYDARYERQETLFVPLPSKIESVIPEVGNNNRVTLQKIKDYLVRSGGKILLSEENRLKVDDIYAFYAEMIAKHGITTKEDMIEHANDFMVHVEDFISQDMMNSVDADTPKLIVGNSKIFAISYTHERVGGKEIKVATIQIPEPKDVQDLLTVTMPAFTAVDTVSFALSYEMQRPGGWSSGQRMGVMKFSSLDELRTYYEQYIKAEEKRLRRHERKEQESVPQEPVAYGKESDEKHNATPSFREEKKEKVKIEPVALDISDIRNLLAYFRSVIQVKPDRELKDKDKVLERIKEVSSKGVDALRKMEQTQSQQIDPSTLADLMQSVRVLAKRIGVPVSLAEQLPYLYKHNQNALLQAAIRNDVEKDEDLLKKIIATSIEYSLEDQKLFTEEKADEVLVELV
jgi:superfamily II DNA/RNA helicase